MSRCTASPSPTLPSLSDLFREHHDFVWRSVRRLGLPDAHVDDAVQEVFLVAFRRLTDFEGRSSLRTWLFGIALRVVKDHKRKAMRADRRIAALPAPIPGPDLEETLARTRAVRLLDDLLGQLDEPQRTVFVMAEVEGMTAPEISSLLDVKLNTVYSRLRLARCKFQSLLARYREHMPVPAAA
jgi:RNA polymerase sigma-70 factor (ECF subfamily)